VCRFLLFSLFRWSHWWLSVGSPDFYVLDSILKLVAGVELPKEVFTSRARWMSLTVEWNASANMFYFLKILLLLIPVIFKLKCNNLILKEIIVLNASYVCLHTFLFRRESPDLDPGRQTPHFWGGSVTATWASDPYNRRSLSVHCVFLDGSLVAWKTKKQITVSRSNAEVELHGMDLLIAEVTWLWWLLEDFGVSVSMSTPLLSDSTWAISITRDLIKHEFTKYIGVDAYYTWSQVHDSVIALQYVPSELHLVDFFMKAQTQYCWTIMSLRGGIRYVLSFSIVLFIQGFFVYSPPPVYVYIRIFGPHINTSVIHNKLERLMQGWDEAYQSINLFW
jgi:hypothetical protein